MSGISINDLEDYSDLIDDEEAEPLTQRELQKLELKKTTKVLRELSTKVEKMTEVERIEFHQMLEDAERLACEMSLAVFFRCAWPYLDTAEYKHNWHFDIIGAEAEKIVTGKERRLMVNMPPRCGKSLLLTVAFPVWVWIQSEKGPLSGPQVKFIAASYGQSLSFEHSNLCRKLMASDWFKRHWGKRFCAVDDRNAIGYFENDKGGYRLSTSVGTGITGRGGDCVREGTPVSTPYGNKNIEDIGVGDEVYSFDSSRGEVATSLVLATAVREESTTYEICTTEGLRLECTGNHPVYIEGRGYVAAQEIRRGDRVVVLQRASRSSELGVRLLRKNVPASVMRRAEKILEGARRFVLQCGLLACPPCDKKQRFLSCLRQAERKSLVVLLAGVQSIRKSFSTIQARQSSRKNLYDLRQPILESCASYVFKKMRQLFTLISDARECEFEFQEAWQIFEPISEDSSFYPDTRQSLLFRLRESGSKAVQKMRERQEISPVMPPDTPHRREHAEQHSSEFNYPMQRLPQEPSPRNIETVTRVEEHGGGTHRFYDIQVERFCCFFANDILVHNCILVDDPTDTAAIVSAADRMAVINWYTQSLATRFNDPKTGALVLVMQRQAADDLSGYFLENEYDLWRQIVFKMRYESNPYLDYDPRSEEGELLWPDRVPEEEVNKQERILGSWGFEGQYQQRPSPKGGGLIKSNHWKVFPPEGQEEDWKRDGVICWPPFEFMVASVDLAYTEKQEGDFSAFSLWGLWHDKTGAPKIVAVHAWQDRLSFNPLVMRIGNNCRKFKPDVLLIEAKAAGISAAQEIQRVFGSGDWSTILVNPKGDKVSRVVSVQGLFEEGLIYGPEKDWCEMLIEQCAVFPKGKHDDLVDTMTQALRWMRDNGLIRRRDEQKRYVFDSIPKSGELQNDAPPYDC